MRKVKNHYPHIRVGETYGHIQVISDYTGNDRSLKSYNCKCTMCGQDYVYCAQQIHNQQKRGGACARCNSEQKSIANSSQYIGRKFGELTVIGAHGFVQKTHRRVFYMHCLCDCGKECDIQLNRLLSGNTKTCGHNISNCLQKGYGATSFEGTALPSIAGTRATNKNNSSGYTGVSTASNGKWRAYIVLRRKQYHLGCFNSPEEAAKAREIAEEILFKPIMEKYREEKNK